jgi:predicted small secreted protein
MTNEHRRTAILIAGAVSTTLLLAGCNTTTQSVKDTSANLWKKTQQGFTQTFTGIPADDSTACYKSHRVPFYEQANEASKSRSVVKGVGDIMGNVVRRQFTGGNYSNQIGNLLAQNFVATMKSVVTDMRNDTARTQQLNTRFTALTNCRRREAATINANYRAGKINRSTAQARLTSLRTVMSQDIAKARETNNQIRARTDEFKLTTSTARRKVAAAPNRAKRREREQEVRKAEDAVQTNQKALNESVASVDEAQTLVTESEGGFNLQSFLDHLRHAWRTKFA